VDRDSEWPDGTLAFSFQSAKKSLELALNRYRSLQPHLEQNWHLYRGCNRSKDPISDALLT
jgi:hypothetical protein